MMANDTTVGNIPHIDQIMKSISLPNEQSIDPGPQKVRHKPSMSASV